jgi:hypothetical protein
MLLVLCGCGSAITGDTQSSSQEIAATSSSDDPEHLVYDNKYPSHPLYYSVKEDFPEYFYLWPTMNFGKTISDELARYDVYGDISVKTEKSQYGKDTEVIQAEAFLPSSGYRDDVQQVGYFKSLGLEKLIDGEWTPYAFKGNSESYYDVFYDNYRYIDVKSIPSEGKTIKMELKTECLYEPLDTGRYRVILFLDDITCRYAEFDIK